MQITKLTNDFYQLTNVFDSELLQKIHTCFLNKSKFLKLWQGDFYRLECGDFDETTRLEIIQQLLTAQQQAEIILGNLYYNSTQLWEDSDGYLNTTHKDSSVNLVANIQVYVLPGDESMGTSIIENEITTSVPYKYNCGYMLLNPTNIEHGMLSAVIDRRMSVYQSYRSTQRTINEW